MPILGKPWTPNYCELCQHINGTHACRKCHTALQPSVITGRCPGMCLDCNAHYQAMLEVTLKRVVDALDEVWSAHPAVESAYELLRARQ